MDTTQIERQLQKKVEGELTDMVEKFLLDVRSAQNKYGGGSFFSLKDRRGDKDKAIKTLAIHELKNILVDSLKGNLGEYMLKSKTKQLLDKLELL